MAGQTKHKGTITIEMKPCQYLVTLRANIFFNLPFCSAQDLWQLLQNAMAAQKLLLIKRHPDKWPRMEWGWPLPDFKMIQDFVRNTPWKNREEKTTIQAYPKLAWQLECPTDKADRMYKLFKAMKTKRSLYCLLGEATTIV
jgi:hypothetical protein